MACEGGIACVGDGGCIEAMPDGTLGQVLTWGAAGPGWAASADDQTAAEVPFTAAGNIAATNVQAALEELDTEKIASVSTGGGIQGDGLALTAVRPDFDSLPVETGVINGVVVTGANSPDGGQVTPYNLVSSAVCSAPDNGNVQPDNLLAVRDPGTGCQLEQWTPFLGSINNAAALPIAAETHAQGDMFVNGGLYVGETDDIVMIRASDGSIRSYNRRIAAMVRTQEPGAVAVPPVTWTNVIFNTAVYADSGITYSGATGEYTVAVAGDYQVDATVSWATNQVWAVDSSGLQGGYITSLSVFINGAFWVLLSENDHYSIGMSGAFRNSGSVVVRVTAGTTIGVRALHLQAGTMNLEGVVQAALANYLHVAKIN